MNHKSMPSPGEPVVMWRKWGTVDYDGWVMGEKVTELSQLKEGEFYLEDKERLSLLNMVKVRIPDDALGIMAYITYVSPLHAPKKRLNRDKEWAVWESYFQNNDLVSFYRVYRAEKTPIVNLA
jgi:hypothetical protein